MTLLASHSPIGLSTQSRSTGIVKAADLFCGAGGTSTALIEAVEAAGMKCQLTGVNHWPVAIATHTENHPQVQHFCEDLNSFDPRKYFRERELDCLWASPSCTSHSNARGGRPKDLDQTRADPWSVVRWLHATLPSFLFVENVPEFRDWGPLDRKGNAIPSQKGEIFHSWVQTIKAAGYKVDCRILCAADYGDPTSRKRFFLQAVKRGRRRIVWPNPTHTKNPAAELFSRDLLPWVPAREIIDWSLPGTSIFDRARPLRPKTLARIEAGLRKFGLKAFLVEPCHDGWDEGRIASMDEPIGTIPCSNRFGLTRPFLIKLRGTSTDASIDDPVPSISAQGQHLALINPYLVSVCHEDGDRTRSVDDPLPTVCGHRGELAICEPFLISYYGTGNAASLADPIESITSRDRFGLVRPTVMVNGERHLLDIRFRMLQPHELALGQGFRPDYIFKGNKTEVVRQIGNAVPFNLALSIVLSAFHQDADAPKSYRKAIGQERTNGAQTISDDIPIIMRHAANELSQTHSPAKPEQRHEREKGIERDVPQP